MLKTFSNGYFEQQLLEQRPTQKGETTQEGERKKKTLLSRSSVQRTTNANELRQVSWICALFAHRRRRRRVRRSHTVPYYAIKATRTGNYIYSILFINDNKWRCRINVISFFVHTMHTRYVMVGIMQPKTTDRPTDRRDEDNRILAPTSSGRLSRKEREKSAFDGRRRRRPF